MRQQKQTPPSRDAIALLHASARIASLEGVIRKAVDAAECGLTFRAVEILRAAVPCQPRPDLPTPPARTTDDAEGPEAA